MNLQKLREQANKIADKYWEDDDVIELVSNILVLIHSIQDEKEAQVPKS